MIPNLQTPGVIKPGQFGPIIVEPSSSALIFKLSISKVGIPSVITTINLIPASKASLIESLQNLAGTKIIDVLAFVFSTALFTSPNTGLSKCLSPAFPGVTPPTMFVPYSMACSQCNVA